MQKIKLNLASGAVVEKPLINAFKANNNSYVILDNEMNGSMGLPIILVSKLVNDKLVKILDQNEWQSAKELLKNIIAGGVVENFKLANSIAADDIYYTQLTLPIPSFDALKNAYKEDDSTNNDNGEIGVMDINLNETSQPSAVAEPISPAVEEPVAPTVEPVKEEAPAIPEVNITPEIANAEMPVLGADVVHRVAEPEITPTPTIETNINTNPTNDSVFKEQKEAFMQACENMFDALVQKFEKELENNK